MRIVFEMPATGIAYFPGLARPVVIEPGGLPPEEARALLDCLATARFFDRPEGSTGAAPPGGGADCRRYAITVDAGERCRTLQVAEPIEDPELARLVRLLEAIARELRRR